MATQPQQVIVVQQPRGNSAAMVAIACVLLGVLTCCLPVVPWLFAILGVSFALMGILVAISRGGSGFGLSLVALGLSFIPFLPLLAFMGLLGASSLPSVPGPGGGDLPTQAATMDDGPAEEAANQPADQSAKERPEGAVAGGSSDAETMAEVATDETPEPPPETTPSPTPIMRPAPLTRTWQDASGKFSVDAEYRGVSFGKVKLRKADGSEISIPIEKLSDADREWIAERAKR